MNGAPANPATASTAARSKPAFAAGLWEKMGMILVFIALFIGASIFVPNFLGATNMKGLALSVATVGIISCTMLFCLAAGDFDLSVGSIVAFAGVLAGHGHQHHRQRRARHRRGHSGRRAASGSSTASSSHGWESTR